MARVVASMSLFSRFVAIGALIVALLLILITSCIPMLLRTSWGRHQFLNAFNSQISGHITAETLDLHWLGPQIIEKIRLYNQEGAEIFAADSLKIPNSLWSLIFFRSPSGLEASGVDSHFAIDDRGYTTLHAALAPASQAARFSPITPSLSVQCPSINYEKRSETAYVELQGTVVSHALTPPLIQWINTRLNAYQWHILSGGPFSLTLHKLRFPLNGYPSATFLDIEATAILNSLTLQPPAISTPITVQETSFKLHAPKEQARAALVIDSTALQNNTSIPFHLEISIDKSTILQAPPWDLYKWEMIGHLFPDIVLQAHVDNGQLGDGMALIGSPIQGDIDLSLHNSQGPVSLHIEGDKGKIDLKGTLSEGILTLESPLTAKGLNPQVLEKYLSPITPLFGAFIGSKSPLTLEINPKGFSCSLIPWNINSLQCSQGTVLANTLFFQGSNAISQLMKFLGYSETANHAVEMTPIYFAIQDGIIHVHRVDLLAFTQFPLALWGDIDVGHLQFSLITAFFTLGKNPFLIPISGTYDHTSIGISPIFKQLVDKLTSSLSTPAHQEVTIPPPTTDPLPWSLSQDSKSGSRVDKIKEGLEGLWKNFKKKKGKKKG